MNRIRDIKQQKRKYPLLLDIMQGGRFMCQIRYTGHPFHSVVDGCVVPTYDCEDKRFVLEQRPSLRGKKDLRIELSKQKVYTM